MPRVIVYPNSTFNPIGVRLLLGEIGVVGPMLQDETSITCVMTQDQIDRFRNSRGAAHRLEVLPDAPPHPPPTPIGVVEPQFFSDDEPDVEDATGEGDPESFPQTWGKQGEPTITVHSWKEKRIARRQGFVRVNPEWINPEAS